MKFSTSPPTAVALLFTRNLGNIVMDLNDVETVHVNTLAARTLHDW